MPRGREQLAAVGQSEVNHHVSGGHDHAADLHHGRCDSRAVAARGPYHDARLDIGDTDLAAGRRYQRRGGKADRARSPAAGLTRSHCKYAVDTDRAVDQLDARGDANRFDADLECVRVPVLRENQSPQALEGLIEGELVSLVQVARWQVLVSDDRGILPGAGANLRVVRVCAGLLAPLACDRVLIGGAAHWRAD